MSPADPRGKSDVILDAAQILFARYGYRRAAIEDIAREAGVAKGTVYLYFENKEAVFRGMIARRLELITRRCEAAIAAAADFEGKIRAVLESQFAEPYAEKFGGSEHLLELGVTSLTVGSDLLRANHERVARQLEEIIEAAVKAGEIDTARAGISPRRLALLLLASAAGGRTGAGGAVEPARYRAHLEDLVCVTLAAVRR